MFFKIFIKIAQVVFADEKKRYYRKPHLFRPLHIYCWLKKSYKRLVDYTFFVTWKMLHM